MKTSNKLLIAGFCTLLLGTAVVLGIVRASAVIEDRMGYQAADYERRPLDSFSEIELHGSIRAHLVQSEEDYLELRNVDLERGDFEVEQLGKKLSVAYRFHKEEENQGRPYINIGCKDPQRASIYDAVVLKTREEIDLESFSLEMHAGTDAWLSMKASTLTIRIGSGSDLKLEGIATKMIINCSSAGDVNAREFQVSELQVKASDGCDIDATVLDQVQGSLSGAADLTCHGSPKTDVQVSDAADFDLRSL